MLQKSTYFQIFYPIFQKNDLGRMIKLQNQPGWLLRTDKPQQRAAWRQQAQLRAGAYKRKALFQIINTYFKIQTEC